ncbi:hypothetical protein ABIC83_002727 [Roseateles asaccharophilus]|uniref:GNAT family N-acetyltransferase n=1 Tax=Roseateles asaccharophilus TaxID=582607 RepID=UPI003837C48E
MTAPRQPIRIERHHGPHSYVAYAGKTVVGHAVAGLDSRDVFCIRNVVVRETHRRRGVATALYREIELQSGKQLVPAISLSIDGFEFWKRFRPEAVANDLRHRRDELMGLKVLKRDRLATIIVVGAGVVTARYDDATERVNSETCIHARDLDQALAAGSARAMEVAMAEAAAAASSSAAQAVGNQAARLVDAANDSQIPLRLARRAPGL